MADSDDEQILAKLREFQPLSRFETDCLAIYLCIYERWLQVEQMKLQAIFNRMRFDGYNIDTIRDLHQQRAAPDAVPARAADYLTALVRAISTHGNVINFITCKLRKAQHDLNSSD